MKIIRTLEVTEKEFYDYLEDDLCQTVNEKTHKTITKKDIQKGLKYNRYIESIQDKIEITIQEYQRGKIYKAKIKAPSDTTIITYRSKQTEEGLEIEFDQYLQSFETSTRHRFFHKFSEAIYLGRMSDALYDIQKKIINKRNGIEEPLKKNLFF